MTDKNKLNIAPVVSPDILKTISAATAIKTFGDQLKNKAKEKVVTVAIGKIEELKNQIEEVTLDEIKLGADHEIELARLDTFLKEKQITEEEYQRLYNAENISYNEKKELLKKKKEKLKQDLDNIINDPFSKLKQNQKIFKKRLKDLKKKTQKEETKANRDLAKQVAINAAKSIAPVIALQLIRQFFNIISQRKKLEDLVDQVNNYIDTQVKDEQTVVIATNLRNNAITLLNNNIKKLENFKKTLDRITQTLTIITTIVAVIEIILGLPFPFLIPLKIKLQPKLQKILTLLAALTTILAIAGNLLGNEIDRIIEIRERLKEISLKLDGKSLDNLDTLTNFFLPTGTEFSSYKGFTFKIKEEQNPKFVVKGNKRRYAVAINRDNIEQLKSEFSFTQDPNDLIEQLKLVIDQQNLQG